MPLDPESSLYKLMHAPVRHGVVMWIGVRRSRGEKMDVVDAVLADPKEGLAGDRYARSAGNRQVTLIQAESLNAIAGHLGRDSVSPLELRRNLVTSGINLHALKGRLFKVGNAVLLATGECHPCSRMEAILGVGGYNAVRGFGGITAESWKRASSKEAARSCRPIPPDRIDVSHLRTVIRLP